MSSVGIESSIVSEWIFKRLSEDPAMAALVGDRIYDWVATPASGEVPKTPLIAYQNQSLRDIRVVGKTRVMSNCLYLVRGIVQGASFVPARPIAQRIDQLLHGAQDEMVGEGLILDSVREEPYQMVDVDEGVQYRHLGGIYRIWAQ